MKKILILGLIVAAVGCSNEPQIDMDEVYKAAALAVIKGSYLTDGSTSGTIARSYTSEGLFLTTPSDQTINIGDELNFSISTTVLGQGTTTTPVKFEYLDVKEGWVVYKITYSDKAVQYTAITSGTGGGIITEHSEFRATQAEVTPGTGGFKFLEKQ